MFWSRKKREEDVDESSVEDENISLDELLETFDKTAEETLASREGWRSRMTGVSMRRSLLLMGIGALLFSVLSVLFLWSGYKDVSGRLDTLPRVELSMDGFEFVGDGTYDNGKMGSGKFEFPIDFGVKEIDLPVYVGTDYENAFMKDKFGLYANRYTVYVKLYGDVYELYRTSSDAVGSKVYSTDDLVDLDKAIKDRGTLIIGTLFGLILAGKLLFGVVGGLFMGTIVYGLVALGGRVKHITYRESLRTGVLVSMLLLFVEIAILAMPMMYGPWLVMRVLIGLGTVLTAWSLLYKAETGVVKIAIAKNRENVKSLYWEYTRERELSKMETLKEETARKKRERKEAKRVEEEKLIEDIKDRDVYSDHEANKGE